MYAVAACRARSRTSVRSGSRVCSLGGKGTILAIAGDVERAFFTGTIESFCVADSERKSHISSVDGDVAIWIGAKVRKARGKMTQARLARKARVTRETIYRLEGGRMATPDVLARVCDALSLDRGELDLKTRETDGLAMHPELTLLRDRRRSLGLTLAECAAAAGVSSATLSRFERGAERSREIASFDHRGRAVHLINDGLADILGFRDLAQMDLHWRTGRL